MPHNNFPLKNSNLYYATNYFALFIKALNIFDGSNKHKKKKNKTNNCGSNFLNVFENSIYNNFVE